MPSVSTPDKQFPINKQAAAGMTGSGPFLYRIVVRRAQRQLHRLPHPAKCAKRLLACKQGSQLWLRLILSKAPATLTRFR